jgi:DNA-binding HxlR family transcriptional regulator
MKQYGQFCPIAKALDVVGDRWTLLIVRELAARPCRYTDLRDGLPGIATNLLAERLKSLEAAGVITAEAAPPPVATTLYRLTERGEALLPALAALGLWGAPLLADANEADEVRSRWLVQATRAMFAGIDFSDVEPLEVALDVDDEPIRLSVQHGQLHAELGTAPHPDVRIACDGTTAAAILRGQLHLDAATRQDRAQIKGTRTARARLARLIDVGRVTQQRIAPGRSV